MELKDFAGALWCVQLARWVYDRPYILHVLRLFTGVILRVVAVVLVLIEVEVAFSGTFSDSESVSSVADMMVCFLDVGAISFNISFWFSVKILVRSTAFLLWFSFLEGEKGCFLENSNSSKKYGFQNEVLT